MFVKQLELMQGKCLQWNWASVACYLFLKIILIVSYESSLNAC